MRRTPKKNRTQLEVFMDDRYGLILEGDFFVHHVTKEPVTILYDPTNTRVAIGFETISGQKTFFPQKLNAANHIGKNV